MINKIYLFILTSLLNLSCGKQIGEHNFFNYFNNNDHKTLLGDSSLIADFLQFNKTVNNNTCWAFLVIACDGYRTYGDIIPYSYQSTYGSVQVSGDSLFSNYSNFPTPMAATNINVKISDCSRYFNKNVFIKATTQNNMVSNFSLYSPQKIYFTGTLADSMSTTISKSNNFNITWNPDPNSTRGVLISLTYTNQSDPTDEIDPETDPIIQNIMVQDNGSYTLTPQILSIFPASSTGKQITITIHRGNYTSSAKVNNAFFPIIIYSKDKRQLRLI